MDLKVDVEASLLFAREALLDQRTLRSGGIGLGHALELGTVKAHCRDGMGQESRAGVMYHGIGLLPFLCAFAERVHH